MCACPTAKALYQPQPLAGFWAPSVRAGERKSERVTAAVYTCFASSPIGVKLEQSDGQTDGGAQVGFA